MKYMILLLGPDSANSSTEEERAAEMEQFAEFDTWLSENRVTVVGGEELQSSTTAVSFHKNGQVTDGPYLEIKEQLGGFFVIETDSEELAREAATRCPNYGGVELRPVVEYGEE